MKLFSVTRTSPQDTGRTARWTGADGDRPPACLWQDVIRSLGVFLFFFSFFSGHQSRELCFLPGPRKSWALHAGQQSAVVTSSHVPFLFQLTILGCGVTTAGWGFVQDRSASPAHCGGEGRGSHIHRGSCLLRPGAYLGSPAQHSPLHPVLVAGDVLGVEQLVGGGVLAQPVLRRGAGVHEGLGHHREAGVSDAVLVDVKHKLGVLDHVDPKPQGQAVWREEADGQGSWGAGGHCTLTQ